MKQIIKIVLLPFFLIITIQNSTILADKETQNLHRYIWANYLDNLDVAQKWYETIFASDKASIHTYKGYIYLLKNTGKFQQIVLLIPKVEADKTITDDPSIQLIFIQALEKTGHRNEAALQLIKTNNKYKDHQEIAFHTATLHIRRKELKSALIVIDNFLSNCSHRPNNFMFYFLKSQILVQLNQHEQALEQIKKCLEIHPSFDKGWLFYAMLREKDNKLNESIKAYTTYLELTSDNKEVERHLLQLIFKQTMVNQQSKSITIDASILKRAILLFEQKRYREAIERLKHHLNKKSELNADNPKVSIRLNVCKKELKLVKQKLI